MLGLINEKMVNRTVDELFPLAGNFYGKDWMDRLENGLRSFDISLVDKKSFEIMLTKYGYDRNFIKSVKGFCGCSLENEFIHRYIVLSGIRNRKYLYSLLAHELFGHGVGIVHNVVEGNGYGYGPYRGFTYFDKVNGVWQRKNFLWEEGFALYMEMNIFKQLGMRYLDGYGFKSYLLAENIFEILFDKVPVLKEEILDSYIMKSKSLGTVIDGVMGEGYFDNLSFLIKEVDVSDCSLFVRQNCVASEVNKLVKELKK